MAFENDRPIVQSTIYDADGNEVSVKDGYALDAGSPALLAAGTDGTNAKILLVDTDGKQIVVSEPAAAPNSATSSVAASASNVLLLASNADRRGATVYNDSNQTLFLKLGVTASLSDFTVRMIKRAYYEVPYDYTGQIDGIWESGASGNARVTELT